MNISILFVFCVFFSIILGWLFDSEALLALSFFGLLFLCFVKFFYKQKGLKYVLQMLRMRQHL